MPFQVTKDPVERNCCVPICCYEKFTLTHRFPANEQRCDEWLLALDIPKLYSIPKQKLLRSHFVCTRHFRDEDYKFPTSRHLNSTAVPSINIKDLSELDLVSSRWHLDGLIPSNNEIRENINEDDHLTTINDNIEISINLENENLANEVACLDDNIPLYIEIDEIDSEDNDTTVSQSIEILGNKSLKKRLKSLLNEPVQNKRIKYDIEEIPRKNTKEYVSDDIQNLYTEIGETVDEPELPIESLSDGVKEDISSISISHPDYEEDIEINVFWLRDHCKCNLCYNFETFQRRTNILDIPLDITPVETAFKFEKLFVKWDDGHKSEYDIDFILKSQYKEQISLNLIDYHTWNKEKIENNKFAEVDFGNFLSDEKLAITVVSSLVKYGFAFIKNVPPTTDMTEMTIKRLFPIQKTLFGEMWTFTNNKDRADTAYTTEYLGPHTDNTYFCDAAGLQIFHCIKYNGTGGDSIFVDGFNAIKELQLIEPESFKLLTKINVPAEYIDKDQHHKYSAPIIKLNSITGQPEQIRYNLYDRSDFIGIELNEIKSFYKSLKKLTEILNDNKNIYKYKLKPGTVVIFDNWRLLHGRDEFTGERVMTGCYVSRTDYMSKARLFGLVK